MTSREMCAAYRRTARHREQAFVMKADGARRRYAFAIADSRVVALEGTAACDTSHRERYERRSEEARKRFEDAARWNRSTACL
jgi:hypothetical protein